MLGAQGIYRGGYPWSDLSILTAADLNAAIALALQEPQTLDPTVLVNTIPDGSLQNAKLATPYIVIGATTIPLGAQNINMLTGLALPVNPTDVATKAYVDNVVGLEGYTAGVGLTLIGNQFNLANTTVTPGTYGSGTLIPQITVNQQGQITGIGQLPFSLSAQNLTNGVTGSGAVVLAQNPTLSGNLYFNAGAVVFNARSMGMWVGGSPTTPQLILGTTAGGNPSAPMLVIDNAGNLTTAGGITSPGNAQINGTLTVGGNVVFDGNLTVEGNSVTVEGLVLSDRSNPANSWTLVSIGSVLDGVYNGGVVWHIDPSGNLTTNGGVTATGNITSSNNMFCIGLQLNDRVTSDNWVLESINGTLAGVYDGSPLWNVSPAGTLTAQNLGAVTAITVGPSGYIGSGSGTMTLANAAGGNLSEIDCYASSLVAEGNVLAGGTAGTRVDTQGMATAAGIAAGNGQSVGFVWAGVMHVYAGGVYIGDMTYTPPSDARLKEHVQRLDPDYAGFVIDGLTPVAFDWIAKRRCDGRPDFGFIAQEAHKVFPNFVTPGQGEPDDADFRPWLLDPAKLVPLLVAELQAVRSRLDALEGFLVT